ncbi:gluconate:H+ symporter [Asticcacaulis sp. AC402]|uniref:GntT/GntP/DsdX family permease n=1 Tax=Asticcacaulis sp. AC402 TaxID=1282361 RepID=UPI0003C40B78|nr:gluconate:H+ symporter [Asticcacaulis sp. AC402]ESQ75200.1 Gnt-II system L-idonate transporter IdnT [Asticcacaulis sp. AC402]
MSIMSTGDPAWALTAVAIAVIGLVVMIAWGKMQPLLAFVIAAIAAALMLGMPLGAIPKSVEKGIGDMLGSLAVLLALGAVFGKVIADSGAAQKIAKVLVRLFGASRMPIALSLTGFIVGIPLFYNVGFVLMVPLIFSLVRQSGKGVVYIAIPLMAGLSIAHGFLPPHPSPTAIVPMFGADMGLTLIYGLIVGIPTLMVAGPLFAMRVKNIQGNPPDLFVSPPREDHELPGAFNSFATALLPVALLAGATAFSFSGTVPPEHKPLVDFLSHPILVLLIALLVAVFTVGIARGQSFQALMESSASAIREIAPILLIIAGAGALKQVFIDSGVSAQLGESLRTLPVPPLVLGWLIAGIIRVALGSATVAGLTAAGLVAPLVAVSGVDPNLMVLAIGAGSLMFSHVNDSGFWMFKAYFGLSIKDTLKSWTLMEGAVGIAGLISVLVLDIFV